MAQVRKLIAAWLVVALMLPAAALAQSAEPDNKSPDNPTSPDERYPVSLDRIRRGLVGQPRTREVRKGLKIEYYVEVYGRAPRLELFTKEENLTSAPVMYGGMTHQEFLQVVTPQEFKAPAADIPGAIAALIAWAVKKNKK